MRNKNEGKNTVRDGDEEWFLQTLDADPNEDVSGAELRDQLIGAKHGIRDREDLEVAASAAKLKDIRGDDVDDEDEEVQEIARLAGVARP